MKKLIAFTILLSFSWPLFSQTDSAAVMIMTKDDYRAKARKQRTAGWILAGVGSGCLLVTGVVDALETTGDAITGVLTLGSEKTSHNSYVVPYCIGFGAILASIPLFVSSSANSRKAKITALGKMETVPVLVKSNVALHRYPSLALKLKL